MESYLLPEDDGLPIRSFGPWVTEKLDYLKRYIDIFETSMRDKPWRRRNYIDDSTEKSLQAETSPVDMGGAVKPHPPYLPAVSVYGVFFQWSHRFVRR